MNSYKYEYELDQILCTHVFTKRICFGSPGYIIECSKCGAKKVE